MCLPFADSSFAVRTLQQTGQLTYCFNQRALNYPGFRAQVRQTLDQHEQVLGIRHVEIAGIYQTNTQADAAGCQVWHSMPETHGCGGCGAWVHYLNKPVIIEYRWQAGYSDWKTTITHEVGHIYGLHEHYDDANFRSHRGSYGFWAHGMNRTPGTATDARTVMDFGMSSLFGNLAWQFSEYDRVFSCQNMDPRGQFIIGCGFQEPEPEPEPCIGVTNAFGHAHDRCNGWWVSVSDAFVGVGNVYHYTPITRPDGSVFTGGWEWSACRGWGGRDNALAQLSDRAGEGTYVWWLQRWVAAPSC